MSSSLCGTPVPTATLYQTRTTVLPTQIVTTVPNQDDTGVLTTTISSSYTTTLQLATDTLFSTPACPTSASAATSSSSRMRATSTTQTLTSALATVSDASGAPSVVYVTYTQTRSSLPPVIVTVGPTDDPSTAVPAATSSSSTSSSSHTAKTGIIAGVVVGAIAAIILIALAVVFGLKRRRNRAKNSEALDDLFQRSNGGDRLMAHVGPSRGNSHHSTITKSYLAEHDTTNDEKQEAPPVSTLPRRGSAPLTPTWPLWVDTAASPHGAAGHTPPDTTTGLTPAEQAPRLDRSASTNSGLHRLSNPNLLAAMDVPQLSPSPSAGNTPPSEQHGEQHAEHADVNRLAARPPAMTGSVRSTPSSPTYPPHATLHQPWLPRVASPPPRVASPPFTAARPHSTANDFAWAAAAAAAATTTTADHAHRHHHHNSSRHSVAGMPASPTYPVAAAAGAPPRAMSPPPMGSNAPPRRIHRNRTLSAGSLSNMLSDASASRPSSPPLAQSFGIQPVPTLAGHNHSHSYSSLPQRRSTASPPPLGSYRGDWPPSRYGHLDIGRRLSIAVEEQQQQRDGDGGGAAVLPTNVKDYHQSMAAQAAMQADSGSQPQPQTESKRQSFWRSNVHATHGSQGGSTSSTQGAATDADEQDSRTTAAAERQLWGNHNLFVLNADAEQDDD